jgi:3',5'-cyclic AMP phosphodiesterase CpdA
MRLIHLSDIHLSKSNYHEFIHKYRKALIEDLIDYNQLKKIDIIIITGDLVDKGGHSLLELEDLKHLNNPFEIFDTVFIQPIIEELGVSSNQVIFIPGNHDINEKDILYYEECQMIENLTDSSIETYLSRNKFDFVDNKRIKQFKEFEKKFHINNLSYESTNNNSTFTHHYNKDFKVGFILINDSWRCKSKKIVGEKDELFFGYQQLDYSLNDLKNQNTDINICLFHHSLNDFSEKREIERILRTKEIELFLYGHHHSVDFDISYNSFGSCIGIRGRAALNNPKETTSEYQAGYQIIDLDLNSYKISRIHYRKYIYDSARFDYDTDNAKGGIDEGKDIFNLNRENTKTKGYNLDKTKFYKTE